MPKSLHPQTNSPQQPSSVRAQYGRKGLFLQIIGGLITILFFVSMFLLAGRLSWFRGWAFLGLLIIGSILSGVYLWRKNPELMKRRSQIGEGTKTWDLIILALFGLTYLPSLIVAALDTQHHWSTMTIWLWPVGAVLFASFMVVITWGMAVNPYFEKTVRIQRDRSHHVITSGPYRIVRHPGYTATIIGLVLATPLLLGSWWAFIPALLSTACLILRTTLEDRTLHQELPGYDAYTRNVRYRLVPGLW